MTDDMIANAPVILVVDDDEDLRRLITLALSRAGFSATEAGSGNDALDVVARQAVDAVILDLGMPGMSGIDVINSLRRAPETATLPILLMTGSGDHDTVLVALEAGADDFLAKPLRLDELVARLRAHLRTSTAWTNQVTGELRARADLVGALGSLPLSSEPDIAAAALVSELGRSAACAFVAVLQLADRGRLKVLATYDKRNGVGQDRPLEASHSRYLMSRLRDGPWVEIIGSRPVNDSSIGFLPADIDLAAGAPIYAGDRVVGMLVTGQSHRDVPGRAATREKLLAAGIDYANILSVAAGPAIAQYGRLTATRARLQRVIDGRALYPVFQPIVDLPGRQVMAYEALTRFTDGTPPDVRFAEALDHGLGLDLESATIQEALRAAVALPGQVPISLNASPAFVLNRKRLNAVMSTASRPLILELTEHARIDDYAAIRRALAAYGSDVSLAVDDAGAGYASLRHILELRPDFVKLDLSIVRGIEDDAVRQALVSGLVFFAQRTGSELIAEGVETDAEAQMLQDLGIWFGQGFLLGRPERAP